MADLTRTEKRVLRKEDQAQQDGVTKFAKAMLRKLELRNVKVRQGTLLGQKKDHDIWFYFKRIKGELGELQRTLKRHDLSCNEVTRDAVLSECCDIANFAAAVAEKADEDVKLR